MELVFELIPPGIGIGSAMQPKDRKMIKIAKLSKLRILQGVGGPRPINVNTCQEFEIFESTRVYDCHSVAQRLRQSESSIREKVFKGQIPFFKAGEGKNAPVRFLGQALNQWLERINQKMEVKHIKPLKTNKNRTHRGVKKFENFVENLEQRN